MKTWEELVEIEPDLKRLESIALANKDKDFRTRSTLWRRQLKKQMWRLVGWGTGDKRLSDSDSYNTAYQRFIDILGI